MNGFVVYSNITLFSKLTNIMPVLVTRAEAIPFDRLSTKKIGRLPEYARPAAALILEWLQGQKYFPMQTSGSTGEPKTFLLERDKIEHSAELTVQLFGLQDDDTLLLCLGANYIAGFMMVMRAVKSACNLIVVEPSSDPFRNLSDGLKIDFASFIPMQMETLLQQEEYISRLNRMKAILVGGAPVSDALDRKLQQLTVPVVQTYSMTETYTHVAVRYLNGEKRSEYYYPLPGVNLSQDERGCLVIKSFLTDQQPLVTNDIVEFQPDGSFKWIGRWDNVINSGGVKIQLEKIENALHEVLEARGIKRNLFAAGLPDDRLGQKLVAVIEGEELPVEVMEVLEDKLKYTLGAYELPKEFYFIEQIPLTRTGKVDRGAWLATR
jgi:O-succinylbenzoic acid--CoA ligase